MPETSGISASMAADRHALCLISFAQHHRDAMREAVTKTMAKFNELPIDRQLKELASLGEFTFSPTPRRDGVPADRCLR